MTPASPCSEADEQDVKGDARIDPHLSRALHLDPLIDKAVQVRFEDKEDASEELVNKYNDLLSRSSRMASQLDNYESQLMQSEEQLYGARAQVDLLTAKVSEEQDHMQLLTLKNLNSFLNSTVVKLERKLEAQKESFDFSTEQHNMHLEDVRSHNRDLQTNISDESSQSILLQQQSVWEHCRRSYETQLMPSRLDDPASPCSEADEQDVMDDLRPDLHLACALHLDPKANDAVRVCFEDDKVDASGELGIKCNELLRHCLEATAQLDSYESQLMQSEKQLYAARLQIDSLTAQVSGEQQQRADMDVEQFDQFSQVIGHQAGAKAGEPESIFRFFN